MTVSIHAPRAGRDAGMLHVVVAQSCFNPRAPCGARPRHPRRPSSLAGFNPRAPCGARPFQRSYAIFWTVFQSTLPVRGATHQHRRGAGLFAVSIHAPRAGRDAPDVPMIASDQSFNPRAPCGARHPASIQGFRHTGCFNPRAPCGARPSSSLRLLLVMSFQSTRPVRGATFPPRSIAGQTGCFNPRAPCGARPAGPKRS